MSKTDKDTVMQVIAFLMARAEKLSAYAEKIHDEWLNGDVSDEYYEEAEYNASLAWSVIDDVKAEFGVE